MTKTLTGSGYSSRLVIAPRRVKVALIGSRGIPPRYGGAETFVYELSKRLKEDFDVYVTCEDDGFYLDEHEGVRRVHIWARHTPTMTIPTIYDIVATLYLLKKAPDIDILFYVAPDGAYATALAKLARKKTVVSTDGIEWQRLLTRIKYVPPLHKPIYLLTALAMFFAEFLTCKIPDATIADAVAIKHYIERRWKPKKAVYVAYGVRQLPQIDEERQKTILHKLGLEKHGYYLTVGRIVAENNIHMEIQAFIQAKTNKKLVIVGPINPSDPYVKYLQKLKKDDPRIIFTGPIYNTVILSALRANCKAYIHAYTVGGTNPSLLEQLQYNRPILAYDVPFHREILREKGIYFKTAEELRQKIEELENKEVTIQWNLPKIFTWQYVANIYRQLFRQLAR
jgi:glycosyltransferase involved in cell wall biosynthesis